MWILGNSFLRGFYSTHDMRRNKFGFAVNAGSTKNHPRYGVPPAQLTKLVKTEEWIEDKTNYTILIIISVIGVVGIAAVLYFVLKDEAQQTLTIQK